jgi:hypothetical protein
MSVASQNQIAGEKVRLVHRPSPGLQYTENLETDKRNNRLKNADY